MQIVPLQAVPSQALTTTLGDQACQINVYQKAFGLFVDLYVDNALVLGGVIAQNRNRIVRSTYLGFSGDLAFIDKQGRSDPTYEGLGDRYVLAYFTDAEVSALLST